jgi:AcrR family transcriptional regulator
VRRPGRPPGESDTRTAILTAARSLFAELGYDRASIRAIARRAGVDAALVHHYYGTKDELLAAAVRLPFEPATLVLAALADPDRAGEVLARQFFALWESATIRDHMLALARAALTHPVATEALRSMITRQSLEPIVAGLELPNAPLRAELVGTHLFGLAMGRYGLGLEPLASTDIDTIAAAVGPTLQRYLTDPDLFTR